MFDRIFRILLILLPWSVLGTVFLGNKLGIPGISFFKEIFLIALLVLLAMGFLEAENIPQVRYPRLSDRIVYRILSHYHTGKWTRTRFTRVWWTVRFRIPHRIPHRKTRKHSPAGNSGTILEDISPLRKYGSCCWDFGAFRLP